MLIASQKTSIQIKGKFFRGFADNSRLAILEALRCRPLTVTQIIRTTGLSQPNTSNHLACLRDCGLVTAQQKGRQVFYELSDPRVLRLLELSDELLIDVARGVYQCVNFQPEEG